MYTRLYILDEISTLSTYTGGGESFHFRFTTFPLLVAEFNPFINRFLPLSFILNYFSPATCSQTFYTSNELAFSYSISE